jgi:hypothetical protein
MIKSYLKQIIKTTTQGDAREESYYGHLSDFLMAYTHSAGKQKRKFFRN